MYVGPRRANAMRSRRESAGLALAATLAPLADCPYTDGPTDSTNDLREPAERREVAGLQPGGDVRGGFGTPAVDVAAPRHGVRVDDPGSVVREPTDSEIRRRHARHRNGGSRASRHPAGRLLGGSRPSVHRVCSATCRRSDRATATRPATGTGATPSRPGPRVRLPRGRCRRATSIRRGARWRPT